MATDGERIAVLESELKRAHSDMDEIAEIAQTKARENEAHINQLRAEVGQLRAEVLKYKWMTSGVVACLAAIAWLLNLVGIDYFKKG